MVLGEQTGRFRFFLFFFLYRMVLGGVLVCVGIEGGGFCKRGVGCWFFFWKVKGGRREVVECRVMKRGGGFLRIYRVRRLRLFGGCQGSEMFRVFFS